MNTRLAVDRLRRTRKVAAGSEVNEDNKDYANVIVDRSNSTGTYTLEPPGSFGPQVKRFKVTDSTANDYAIKFNSTAVLTLGASDTSTEEVLWDEDSETWR